MRYIIVILLATTFFISSCSDNAEQDKLFNVYKQILIARNSHSDSLEANKAVIDVLKMNGYTELQFRNEFLKMAMKEKSFMKMIDSLRTFMKIEQEKILDSAGANPNKKNLPKE